MNRKIMMVGVFLTLVVLALNALFVSAYFGSSGFEKDNPARVLELIGQSYEVEENTDADDEAAVAFSEVNGVISEEEAIAIAYDAVDVSLVGKMTDIEIEREGGQVVYAVEFTKGGVETDVKIVAATGAVLLIESDLDEVEKD